MLTRKRYLGVLLFGVLAICLAPVSLLAESTAGEPITVWFRDFGGPCTFTSERTHDTVCQGADSRVIRVRDWDDYYGGFPDCLKVQFTLPKDWGLWCGWSCSASPSQENPEDPVYGTSDLYFYVGVPENAQPGTYCIKVAVWNKDADPPDEYCTSLSFPEEGEFTLHVTVAPDLPCPGYHDWLGASDCCGPSYGVAIAGDTGAVHTFGPGSEFAGVLLLQTCGDSEPPNGDATWIGCCDSCYEFVCDYTGEWGGYYYDRQVRIATDGGVATVTLPDGTKFAYDIGNNWFTGGVYGAFGPSTVTDPSGRVTTFAYYDDDPTNPLVSVTTHDGRTGVLEHSGCWYPTAIFGPDQNPATDEPRTAITYDFADRLEWPAVISVRDPINPETQKSMTSFDYYDDGKVKSVTQNSGLKTEVTYWPDNPLDPDYHVDKVNKVRFVRVMDSAKVYSQTGYDYGTASDLGDQVTYGTTTIREYEAVGTTTTLGTANDNLDRLTKRYYYLEDGDNTFLRAVKSIWKEYEDEQYVQHSTLTEYTVDTNPAHRLYGKVTSVTDPLGVTTSYTYYDPDVQYAASVATQYDITNRNSVPYSTPGSDVYGNGMVMTETFEVDEIQYTTTYRYMVKTIDSELVMTPFVTITKDTRGWVTKRVLNTDGSVSAVYEDKGEQTLGFDHVRSFDYYGGASGNKDYGLLRSETVHGVASLGDGSARDNITYYQYFWPDDPQDEFYPTYRVVKATETDGNGDIIFISGYNELDQLEWTQNRRGYAEGYDTDYAYDYQGRPTTTTYPAIVEKTLPPDALKIEPAGTKTVVNTYDCCFLADVQDENEHEVHYAYDGKGRLLKIWTDIDQNQSENAPLVEYVYAHATNPERDIEFGALKEVKTRSAQGTVRTTSYTYDGAGNLKQIDYPQGLVGPEEFIYDDYGRIVLKQVLIDDDPEPDEYSITAYEYDDLSRVTDVDYDYEGDFELPLSGFSANVEYDYEGASGLVTSVSETIDEVYVESEYTYDTQGRMETYTPGLPSDYGTIAYDYNNLGQKESMTVPIGVADRDGDNNEARRIQYKYDRNGKQIGMKLDYVPATTGTTLGTTSSSSQTKFYYDHNQKRVKMTTKAGAVFHFVYDPTASIPAVVYEEGANRRFVNIREPDGSLVSREYYSSTSGNLINQRTYHFDGLGSTAALSDEDGEVTDRYTYDAWGNVTNHWGDTWTNPYRFVGQLGYYNHDFHEPDFDLLQLGVRYYDPTTGRFTQWDPARHGVNKYEYVSGGPLGRVDPSGLDWTIWNFAHWYYYGLGHPVDLGRVVLDDYRTAGATADNTQSFHSGLKRRIQQRAQSECGGASTDKVRKGLTYQASGLSHLGEQNVRNPLLSISNHALGMAPRCRLEINCWKKEVLFVCRRRLGFNDTFSGPFSFRGMIGIPIEHGMPHAITASFGREYSGIVKF